MARRRTPSDLTTPRNAPSMLVVRNQLGHVVESRPVEAGADRRAILTAERERRIAEGWSAEPLASVAAFFFCSRDGERLCVSIEVGRARP